MNGEGRKKYLAGNLAALFTILVWGTTFVSTKVLLTDFTPVEILFFRFVMGFVALIAAYPRRLKVTEKKQELYFIAAGICGVTLYFLLENIALTYTLASNVGIIITVSPFFTAIFTRLFVKGGERLHMNFFIGFVSAMIGVSLISFNGKMGFELNPLGDILAVGAAIVWAAYSVLTKKIGTFGYHVIPTTRRIFGYGLVFMIPALFLFEFHLDFARFLEPVYLFNILFLGLGASALCFVTWNYALKTLGAVKTTVFMYITPVVTVIASMIVLKETVTSMAVVGIAFTLAGLYFSEKKLR